MLPAIPECMLQLLRLTNWKIICSTHQEILIVPPDCVKQRCELIMNNTYQRWCEDEYFDADTRAELKAIADDPQEIKERFTNILEFGTGGLRGILGAGTNRMNIYTVRKATQGLANFIIKENAQAKGVAIAFDSRHMSPEFAKRDSSVHGSKRN